MALCPLLAAVWLSLGTASSWCFREERFIGLGNYAFLLRDARFWSALGNTAYFTALAVALELLLALPLALSLDHASPGAGLLRAAVLVPWAIPTVVAAKLWAWLFNPDSASCHRLCPAARRQLARPARATRCTPPSSWTSGRRRRSWRCSCSPACRPSREDLVQARRGWTARPRGGASAASRCRCSGPTILLALLFRTPRRVPRVRRRLRPHRGRPGEHDRDALACTRTRRCCARATSARLRPRASSTFLCVIAISVVCVWLLGARRGGATGEARCEPSRCGGRRPRRDVLPRPLRLAGAHLALAGGRARAASALRTLPSRTTRPRSPAAASRAPSLNIAARERRDRGCSPGARRAGRVRPRAARRARWRRALLAAALAISMFPPIATVAPLYLAAPGRAAPATPSPASSSRTRASPCRSRCGSSPALPRAPRRALPRRARGRVHAASARSAGCSSPSPRPALATAALLVFIFAWNEFLYAVTFLTSPARRTVPVAISLFAGEHTRALGRIAAAVRRSRPFRSSRSRSCSSAASSRGSPPAR